MELDLRIKYWLVSKGLSKAITPFKLSAKRGYSYRKARNFLLHTNFANMGLLLNAEVPFERHEKLANAIGMMFEGKDKINDIGRLRVINSLTYVHHAMAREMLYAYISTVTDLTEAEFNEGIIKISNGMYDVLFSAIVGFKTELNFTKEVRDIVKTQKTLRASDVKYLGDYGDARFESILRTPEGIIPIPKQVA